MRHARRRDFDEPGWAATAARPHDPPLSRQGERQAGRVAERLAREAVDAIFSSPFLRCVETAAPLAERLRLPLRLEPGLSEWLHRAWFPAPPRLRTTEEMRAQFPRVDAGYAPRGRAAWGESGEQALRRAGETARVLVEEFPGTLVLVGHGASTLGALMGLLAVDREHAVELDYGGRIRLRRDPECGGPWEIAWAPRAVDDDAGGRSG